MEIFLLQLLFALYFFLICFSWFMITYARDGLFDPHKKADDLKTFCLFSLFLDQMRMFLK